MQTPWGKADSIVSLNGNTLLVSTPSHGGLGVPTETLKAVLSPSQFAYVKRLRCSTVGQETVWLEEDCDCLIGFLFVPGLFEAYAKACLSDRSESEIKAIKASMQLGFGFWHKAWPVSDSDI